jgi:hypothetical protein
LKAAAGEARCGNATDSPDEAGQAKQSRGHTDSLSLAPGLLRFARNDGDALRRRRLSRRISYGER